MRTPWLGWAVFTASCLLLVLQLWTLHEIHLENARISRLLSGQDIPAENWVNAVPEVRLARAVYLHQKHRYDEALAALSLIIEKGDRSLQAKTRYNLGNVYLGQAVEKVDAMAVDEALPLVLLAKQAYREALALDCLFWDAKYNLEVAMRLLPEMDRINIEDEGAINQTSQLWTTVPGFPRGLP